MLGGRLRPSPDKPPHHSPSSFCTGRSSSGSRRSLSMEQVNPREDADFEVCLNRFLFFFRGKGQRSQPAPPPSHAAQRAVCLQSPGKLSAGLLSRFFFELCCAFAGFLDPRLLVCRRWCSFSIFVAVQVAWKVEFRSSELLPHSFLFLNGNEKNDQ